VRSITSIIDMKSASRAARAAGQKVGFVPTMGALHDGHLSLVRRAKELSDVVIMSIFVNPTQFGQGEDFDKYPRTLARDAGLAAEAGVDILFLPDDKAIYPAGFATWVEVEGVGDGLEGASRPRHFRGVATVVLKLLNIVAPDVAVFGQKDAQQSVIVRRLARDLDLDVEIIVAPTVRESDGLALSSRNVYLPPEDRLAATVLFRALKRAEAAVSTGETSAMVVATVIASEIRSEPRATLDYAEIVSPDDFSPVETIGPRSIAVVAARVGGTRLIDNVILNSPGGGGR
jgi:pantoate--beta-alanine ligase